MYVEFPFVYRTILLGTTDRWKPNTLTNGTNADATQVMTNFRALRPASPSCRF
jgi:hypothetical protein